MKTQGSCAVHTFGFQSGISGGNKGEPRNHKTRTAQAAILCASAVLNLNN